MGLVVSQSLNFIGAQDEAAASTTESPDEGKQWPGWSTHTSKDTSHPRQVPSGQVSHPKICHLHPKRCKHAKGHKHVHRDGKHQLHSHCNGKEESTGTKCLCYIPSSCTLAFCDPKASLNSPLWVLRASEELFFCSSKDKKHLHSGFNCNWRWKDHQKLEELRLRRKRWTKSGVVAFVPVSCCKHL